MHLENAVMVPFIPGLDLAETLYRDAVAPILARDFPDLPYSAALLGTGSDVLGFDTPRSMDHGWGPRLLLFVGEDQDGLAGAIERTLRVTLPRDVAGVSTHFVPTEEAGISRLGPVPPGEDEVNHGVTVTTLARFVAAHLGCPADADLDVVDWLCCTDQGLRAVTAGRVFHDGLETLGSLRQRLAYYPDPLWRHLLAAQWKRISQHEAFVGRAGEVGDERGSALVAAGLVRDAMRLCFLMGRTYAPYEKWFGRAFSLLGGAPALELLLDDALVARTWEARDLAMGRVYERLATLHNDLGITPPLSVGARPYWDRPYRVIHAERFVAAIRATITDPATLALPPGLGSLDQIVDATDLLTHPRRRTMCAYLYGDGG